MFYSIGALSGSPGLRFLCSYFVGAPSNPSGVNYSQVTDGYGWLFLLGIHTKTQISFRHQRLFVETNNASHLQVFKLSEMYNYLVRNLMYT